jgi:hypothetical protein
MSNFQTKTPQDDTKIFRLCVIQEFCVTLPFKLDINKA